MTSWVRHRISSAASIAYTAEPLGRAVPGAPRRPVDGPADRREFPALRSSVPVARAWLGEQVRRLGQGEEVAARVELLISELAGNAVQHAAGNAFTVRVSIGPMLEICVEDQDPSGAPRVCRPDPDDTHGRGLAIVDAISDCWGVRRTATGKAVWFRVATASSPG